MNIDETLLLENGAIYEHYAAKETIFHSGDTPGFYFQIVPGTVELNNYHEDGKEFTLHVLSDGLSIAESMLFSELKYPMNAVARTSCKILKLKKESFLHLLDQNKALIAKLFKYLSDRLYYKYVMLFHNSAADPRTKIKALMDYYKTISFKKDPFPFVFPMTRQQIANLTGLRVETVIRAIKKMAEDGLLRIEGRQIVY